MGGGETDFKRDLKLSLDRLFRTVDAKYQSNARQSLWSDLAETVLVGRQNVSDSSDVQDHRLHSVSGTRVVQIFLVNVEGDQKKIRYQTINRTFKVI